MERGAVVWSPIAGGAAVGFLSSGPTKRKTSAAALRIASTCCSGCCVSAVSLRASVAIFDLSSSISFPSVRFVRAIRAVSASSSSFRARMRAISPRLSGPTASRAFAPAGGGGSGGGGEDGRWVAFRASPAPCADNSTEAVHRAVNRCAIRRSR